jgi:hypothetical protein
VTLWQAPLVAAGRLLDFEIRRPGASAAVLELLAAEYGTQVRAGQQRLVRTSGSDRADDALHSCHYIMLEVDMLSLQAESSA